MLSLAIISHWKLAYKAVIKAIKVTIQDLNQVRKSRKYHNKVIDDLNSKRILYEQEKL